MIGDFSGADAAAGIIQQHIERYQKNSDNDLFWVAD